MESPVASSGPILRKSVTFSHRQERALKDVNGRVSVVNKSQEHLSTGKNKADGQNLVRPARQYSAVASRYAAPLASRKQLPGIGNGPQAGQSNIAKLPFITGRAAPGHQRRPSTDNLGSFNPSTVPSAFRRCAKPDTFAKKATEDGNFLGAKRPRATMRMSMTDQKTQVQAWGPRFHSLEKGGCLCPTRGSGEVPGAATVPLLYSAAHWLFLIKLAEDEEKPGVVVDLFRLAITLKAEPGENVLVQLKLYQEKHPEHQDARRLLEECEGVMHVEMVSTTVEACREGPRNSGESNTSASAPSRADTGLSSVVKVTVVPQDLSENDAATDKDVMRKRPHFMGRVLSRSATFSVVDSNSKSVHAKAEYGKWLLETIDNLASQAPAYSHSNTRPLLQIIPLESQPPLDCVPSAGVIRKSPGKFGVREGFDVPASDVLSTPLPSLQTSSSSFVESATLGSESTSTITLVPLEAILITRSTSSDNGTLVSETESKPLSSLSKYCSQKPVDSLSECLDDRSSQMGTPDTQAAPSEENLNFTSNGGHAVKEAIVASLTKEVVSHGVPEGAAVTGPESSATQRQVASSPAPYFGRRQSWQCVGGRSLITSAEKLNVFHRHTLSADAAFLSVHCNGERSLLSVEEKVKLFTELAEVRGTIPATSKIPVRVSEVTGRNAAIENFRAAVDVVENSTQATKGENCELRVEFVVEMEPDVVSKTGIDSPMKSSAQPDSSSGENEACEPTLVTPLPVYTPKMSVRGDARLHSVTPIAFTPCQSASVGNPRVQHRRASSVGNLTSRVPFDMSAESSPSGDDTFSPSSQSSSVKSKLTLRGCKEVTLRMNLPKPSWKAIVEREMKGSKLKDLLAAQLPKKTTSLSEYLEIQMGNQSRDSEDVSIGSTEKIVNLMHSPAKPLRRTMVSFALEKVAPTEEQHGTDEALRSAQLLRKQNEC